MVWVPSALLVYVATGFCPNVSKCIKPTLWFSVFSELLQVIALDESQNCWVSGRLLILLFVVNPAHLRAPSSEARKSINLQSSNDYLGGSWSPVVVTKTDFYFWSLSKRIKWCWSAYIILFVWEVLRFSNFPAMGQEKENSRSHIVKLPELTQVDSNCKCLVLKETKR